MNIAGVTGLLGREAIDDFDAEWFKTAPSCRGAVGVVGILPLSEGQNQGVSIFCE